jgi:hypothetical protein
MTMELKYQSRISLLLPRTRYAGKCLTPSLLIYILIVFFSCPYFMSVHVLAKLLCCYLATKYDPETFCRVLDGAVLNLSL